MHLIKNNISKHRLLSSYLQSGSVTCGREGTIVNGTKDARETPSCGPTIIVAIVTVLLICYSIRYGVVVI